MVIGKKEMEGGEKFTPSYTPGPVSAGKTFIGKTVEIKGNVASKEEMEIQGKIEGNIEAERSVHIRQEGQVKGNIKAAEVKVEGKVEGDITTKAKTIITPTGKVQGKIITDKLVIEEGAVFRGTVEMGPAPSPATSSNPEVKNG